MYSASNASQHYAEGGAEGLDEIKKRRGRSEANKMASAHTKAAASDTEGFNIPDS